MQSTDMKFRKPRSINTVSISLLIVLLIGAFLTYQYLPLYFLQSEAYRVLEETGSKFAGSKGLYRSDARALEDLRRKMQSDLKALGIEDPNIETWIEIDGPQTRLGVIYSVWLEWPLDIIPRQEKVYEVEHDVVLPE